MNNEDFLKCYDDGLLEKKDMRMDICDWMFIKAGDILFDIDAVWDPRCVERDFFLPRLQKKGVIISSYIHDILCITNPEFFDSFGVLFFKYAALNLRYADVLITSTETTAKRLSELARRLAVPCPKCVVSWCGSDFKSDGMAEDVSTEARSIAERGKYVLCVGTVEPRKNHAVILDAYDAELAAAGVNLVFAGRRGWKSDELLKRIDSHPRKNNGFWYLEGENDATIKYLYANAFAVVFATFDEGFGLPAVESLSNGAVTVLSDVPIMREVGGKYCEYFDPKSCAALAKIIKNYLAEPERYERQKEIAKGYKPALWDEVAQKIKMTLLSAKKDEQREQKLKSIGAEQIFNGIIEDIEARGYVGAPKEFYQTDAFAVPVLLDSLQKNIPESGEKPAATKPAPVSFKARVKAAVKRFVPAQFKTLVKKVVRKFVSAAFKMEISAQQNINRNMLDVIKEYEKRILHLEQNIAKQERR